MDRVAVFVDAGHLLAGGASALSGGSRTKRGDVAIDVPQALAYLENKSQSLSGLPLLRIYWYDGAFPNRLTTEQQLLTASKNVKLRLGIVNGHGEQKGVDAKIITDMTELARNRAICDAVLVGGDEDLRIGVELAQEYGVRVHLLSVEHSNVSRLLRCEADTTDLVKLTELPSFLALRPVTPSSAGAPVTPVSPTPTPTSVPPAAPTAVPAPAAPANRSTTTACLIPVDFQGIITGYLSTLSGSDKTALSDAIRTSSDIPAEHDRRILGLARDSVPTGKWLTPEEKKNLRKELKTQLGV